MNVLAGFTAPGRSNAATLSFFADITDAEEGLSGLKKSPQSMDLIEFVDAIAAEDGSMVDKQHFPAQWAGRNGILMRADR